ncbi:uncharacterized protein [Dermacentor andersoni]|uniref:uncharacterized protein n=1 Tax=Dermacentor andersoni TaxID=34620 RepID=UPI002416B06B|nr:uncharacterized protein LOC129386815 [Dermacentor andersoni]
MATCINKKGIDPQPVYAVSVTMKGRWYTPKVDDVNERNIGAYGVFEPCDRFSGYAVPHIICNKVQSQYRRNLEFNDTGLFMQTYDKLPRNKRTLVFDSSVTQLRKICDARYKDKKVAYTIAAYDVNYDYAPSLCPLEVPGLFNRTKSYKKVNQFLAHFNGTHKADCLDIIKG